MGRLVKNTVFRNGSYALGVPTGASSIRPDHPVNGQTRWNTDLGKLEFYGNVTGTPGWSTVSTSGNVYVLKDTLSGTGSLTNFTMTTGITYPAGQEARALVHVGTVYQNPGVDYFFYGNTMIHFNSAPSSGSNNITIIHGYATTTANIA